MSTPHLLVVEDELKTAQMLGTYFQARGYAVTQVHAGQQAIERCRAELPNLILMDIGLPDMDGFAVVRALRRTVWGRYIPVVFLTKRTAQGDRLEGLGLGADDYIVKPFDLEELYLRVQNSINRATREFLTDPRTGLPAAPILQQKLAELGSQSERGAVEFKLRETKPFCELYGAVAYSTVLRATALLLNEVLRSHGSADDFLGQRDEESYVVVAQTERLQRIADEAVKRFGANVSQHYSMGDRHGDQITVTTTAGQRCTLPVMRLEAVPVG